MSVKLRHEICSMEILVLFRLASCKFAEYVILFLHGKVYKSHSYLCFRIWMLPKRRNKDIEGGDNEDSNKKKITILCET